MERTFKMFIQSKITSLLLTILIVAVNQENFAQKPPLNDLLPAEKAVIIGKGTETPFSGKFVNHFAQGSYICKQCGQALFYSANKFDAHCGWPSFDAEIPGAVTRRPDPDGKRTEIICSYCSGHLGHLFTGEGFTPLNTRHCVNSVSLDFVPAKLESGRYGTAIFAGGCFWGVEYFLQKEPGVVAVTSGYTGGHVKNPSYREVCTGKTGHAEAVKVIYDSRKTTYEKLLKLFLEIHDPTQVNRQGPDVGEQYRSEIFWLNSEQKALAEKYTDILKSKGLKVVTRITKASEFYEAEDYHQDYYFKTGKLPYCHGYTKRF